jgi:hypothetical protein
MCDVDGSEHWCNHRGIWFDTTNPRTERFMLYEIPWFAKRCRSVGRSIRNRILGGLILVLPILITFWVIRWLYQILEEKIIETTWCAPAW